MTHPPQVRLSIKSSPAPWFPNPGHLPRARAGPLRTGPPDKTLAVPGPQGRPSWSLRGLVLGPRVRVGETRGRADPLDVLLCRTWCPDCVSRGPRGPGGMAVQKREPVWFGRKPKFGRRRANTVWGPLRQGTQSCRGPLRLVPPAVGTQVPGLELHRNPAGWGKDGLMGSCPRAAGGRRGGAGAAGFGEPLSF